MGTCPLVLRQIPLSFFNLLSVPSVFSLALRAMAQMIRENLCLRYRRNPRSIPLRDNSCKFVKI